MNDLGSEYKSLGGIMSVKAPDCFDKSWTQSPQICIAWTILIITEPSSIHFKPFLRVKKYVNFPTPIESE